MGNRRKAREVALQMLYQLDVQEQLGPEQAIGLYWHHLAVDAGIGSDENCREFADELVRGVRTQIVEIDGLIASASRNWRLERMARVDRNLLRLAVYELKHCLDVPSKVAINEAIEIAKRYGTSESPAFVNGILDRCLGEIGTRA